MSNWDKLTVDERDTVLQAVSIEIDCSGDDPGDTADMDYHLALRSARAKLVPNAYPPEHHGPTADARNQPPTETRTAAIVAVLRRHITPDATAEQAMAFLGTPERPVVIGLVNDLFHVRAPQSVIDEILAAADTGV